MSTSNEKHGIIKSFFSKFFKPEGAQNDTQEVPDGSEISNAQSAPRQSPARKSHKEVSTADIKRLMADLKKKNAHLAAQLTQLKTRAIQNGNMSTREVELEKESELLRNEVQTLKQKGKALAVSYKRLSVAMETIEMLRARNSALNVKVERQKEIIASLSWKDPKNQELSARLKKLGEENRELRERIFEQANLMEKISESFSPPEMATAFKKLLNANRSIEQNLPSQPLDMSKITEEDSPEKVFAAFDQVEDENFKLREILKSRQRLNALAQESGSTPTDMEVIFHSLQEENQRLGVSLDIKQDHPQNLDSSSHIPRLAEKINSYKRDRKKLLEQLAQKDRRIMDLDGQLRSLNNELFSKSDGSLETQQLKSRLEQAENLITVLKKTELKYKKLRTDHAVLETRNKATLAQLQEMTAKVNKLTAAYDHLVKEYEKLFEAM